MPVRGKTEDGGEFVLRDKATGNEIVRFKDGTDGTVFTQKATFNSSTNLTGDLDLQDDDKILFGDDDDFAMTYNAADLTLIPLSTGDGFLIGSDTKLVNVTLKGPFVIGKDGTGHDVQFFGATGSAHILWDESDDALEFLGAATIEMGTSGTPLVFTEGVPVVDLYTTCASVHASTSAQPFYMKSVMTGTGGVGGRATFEMTTNVALGGWSNALKGLVTYGASGKTTGLGSAILAEMSLEAGTTNGNYACFEAELVLPSGASLGTKTSYMHMQVSGADQTTFDDSGYIFSLVGLTVNSGKVFQVNTAADATHALRISIDGVNYFIMLTDQNA